MNIFIKFILIICYFQCNVNARQRFYVGLITDNENEENEIVFRSAIDSVNVDQKIIQLKPIIIQATQSDSSAMEKLTCELISKGVIAIFGPSNAETSNIVSAICYTFEIPHILFDYKPEISITEREFFSMTINLYPNDLVLSRAYASVIQSFSWRKHSLLYEEDNDLIKMQDILQIHGPNDLPATIRHLNPDDEQGFRPILKDLREYKENNLIINCAVENIEPILSQSTELGILTDYQSIFFTHLDAHTVELGDITLTTANITTIRIFDPTDFNVKTITYAWEQRARRENKPYKTYQKVKTKLLLLNDAVWVFAKGLSQMEGVEEIEEINLYCGSSKKWHFGKKIIDFIKSRREEGATGRIDFDEYGRRTYFSTYILEINTDGFEQFSTYDPVNGVAFGESEFNIKKKEVLLANKIFIVSTRIGKPFLFERSEFTNETLTGNDRYEGYSLDLIDEISKIVGFKYIINKTQDNQYGGIDSKTGQWNGIVRQVMDEKADLGICDLTMTSARRKVVDFTPPFMTLGISILFSKAKPEPPDLFSFRLPFSTQVWMYMSACFFGICSLVFITARMAPNDWENPHPCEKDPEEVENVWTIPNAIWLAVGSIMGQGCDLLPKSPSTRILTGMWWFFALMMLNSYTANLAAFLTKSQKDEPIKSVEELARQSKIKYGTYAGGSTMGFFQNSNETMYQKMWSFMEVQDPSVFTLNNDVGEERVVKSKRQYAFFMESSVLEYKLERNCELIQVGSWLDFKTYGIAMPFNSPYRKLVSEAILKLGERGTLADLKRRWWKEKHIAVKCESDDKSGSDGLKLKIENVGGVFLVLGIGLFLAFVIGIVDFFYTIQSLALEEKLSMKDAFITEILFALKFWITTKPVISSSKDENSKSLSKLKDIDSKGSKNINESISLKSLSSANSELLELKKESSKISLNCAKV